MYWSDDNWICLLTLILISQFVLICLWAWFLSELGFKGFRNYLIISVLSVNMHIKLLWSGVHFSARFSHVFQVAVGGRHLLEYKHRIPYQTVTKFSIHGDISLTHVRVQWYRHWHIWRQQCDVTAELWYHGYRFTTSHRACDGFIVASAWRVLF